MSDYRLKVFHTVATRLSFTKAAQELSISQPAVTKHIKELEQQFNTKLFERKGLNISLTESGALLYRYAEKIRNIYRDLEFGMSQTNAHLKGKLKIGASTTVAQYILPEMLAKFHARYPDIRIELLTENTEKVSSWLAHHQIDLGLIEGASRLPLFDYYPFKTDEIVLICKSSHPLAGSTIALADLYNLSFVMREEGSGTQEFIQNTLEAHSVSLQKLNICMRLGSSESIKNYLQHSSSLAFLSIHTVLQELRSNSLSIVDIRDFSIKRQFHCILSKGEQSPLIKLFLNFQLPSGEHLSSPKKSTRP